jgi:ArsR family transcriptional regulator
MKETAKFFKVLGDEARLSMIWLLMNRDELCVCDIMAVLGVTQSKASRHLRTLHNAGLVEDRREGQWSYYRLCTPADGLKKAQMEELRAALSSRKECAAVLKKLAGWLEKKACCGA